MSLSNDIVSNQNPIRPVVYKPNKFWRRSMSKSQHKCCKRGKKAARKGMNCNHSYIFMESGLLILHDFKFKIKLDSEDASFTQKVVKCFLKQDTSQYFTRCCKQVGLN